MKITAIQAKRIKDKAWEAGFRRVNRIHDTDFGGIAEIEMYGRFTPEDLVKLVQIIDKETKF